MCPSDAGKIQFFLIFKGEIKIHTVSFTYCEKAELMKINSYKLVPVKSLAATHDEKREVCWNCYIKCHLKGEPIG